MNRFICLVLALIAYCCPIQAAAPSLIQQKIGGGGCSNNCTVTFDSTPVTGHFVIMTVNSIQFSSCPALSTISDTMTGGGTNTYQVDYNQNGAVNGANMPCTHGGSGKITSVGTSFTVSANFAAATFAVVVIQEWANLDPTTWFDGVTGALGISVTTSTVTRGSANTRANSLVIANMSLESAGHISSPSSGYTLFEAVDSGGWGNSLGYKVVTAGETSSASWSGLASDEFSNAVSVYRGIDAADSTCNSNFMMLGAGC